MVALAYGVVARLEIGFDVPLIAIAGGARRIVGGGDLDLTAKYLVRSDHGGERTALALGFAVELPTGDARRGLGSGVTDVDLTLIAQRQLRAATTLRANLGLQFAGNTLTGAVGTRDRGQVLSAGTSITHAAGDGTQLLAEITGYQGRSRAARDRELRLQAGATRAISARLTLAACVQRGWYAAPPWSLQAGVIIDP